MLTFDDSSSSSGDGEDSSARTATTPNKDEEWVVKISGHYVGPAPAPRPMAKPSLARPILQSRPAPMAKSDDEQDHDHDRDGKRREHLQRLFPAHAPAVSALSSYRLPAAVHQTKPMYYYRPPSDLPAADEEEQRALDRLCTILPNFSRQSLKIVLRRQNGNVEATANALLSGNGCGVRSARSGGGGSGGSGGSSGVGVGSAADGNMTRKIEPAPIVHMEIQRLKRASRPRADKPVATRLISLMGRPYDHHHGSDHPDAATTTPPMIKRQRLTRRSRTSKSYLDRYEEEDGADEEEEDDVDVDEEDTKYLKSTSSVKRRRHLVQLKKKRKPVAKDSDDDDDDDDESGSEAEPRATSILSDDTRTLHASILDFFNCESHQHLVDATGCTKEQADKLIALRPFTGYPHLVEILNATKGLSPRILAQYEDITERYRSVDILIAKCTTIATDLSNAIQKWGGEGTARRTKSDQAGDHVEDGDHAEDNGANDNKGDTGLHLIEFSQPQDDSADDPEFIRHQPAIINSDLTLKGYQLIGISWLWLLYRKGLSGILADDMVRSIGWRMVRRSHRIGPRKDGTSHCVPWTFADERNQGSTFDRRSIIHYG